MASRRALPSEFERPGVAAGTRVQATPQLAVETGDIDAPDPASVVDGVRDCPEFG